MFVLILMTSLVVAISEGLPQVKLDNGIFTGIQMESYNGKAFNAFLGIPYAKPPIGDLRFKNPVAEGPYEKNFNANDDSVMCIQRNDGFPGEIIIGQEDCLYLNVYTPKNFTNKNLAVMFFIHGGGFVSGSGNKLWFGPEFLLDHDIILVSPNYRLGVLGMLTTEDEALPGNYGFKDQQVALRWVQKYIKRFGGNPNAVTIFGSSSGAGSVHLHTMAEGREGLFHRAILQGGSLFGNRALYNKGQAVALTRKYAAQYGCDLLRTADLVQCLNKFSAYDLTEKTFFYLEFDIDPMTPFRPVIEPNLPGAFLIEDPYTVHETGKVSDISLIAGLSSEEGGTRTSNIMGKSDAMKTLNEDRYRIFPLTFSYFHSVEEADRITDAIYSHYFQNRTIDMSQKDTLINCYTDSQELSGMDFSIRLHLHYLKSPVYYFSFAYKGSVSLTDTFGLNHEEDFGVSHSDEIFFLFKLHPQFMAGKTMTSDDMKMVDYMTQMWVDFANIGAPLLGIWKSTTLPYLPYLVIKGPNYSEMSGNDNPVNRRMKFWHEVPYNTKIVTKLQQLKALQKNEL